MCDLCSTNQAAKEAAISSHRIFADRLRELAAGYDKMANGEIVLHQHELPIYLIGLNAKVVIKRLVEDWT